MTNLNITNSEAQKSTAIKLDLCENISLNSVKLLNNTARS